MGHLPGCKKRTMRYSSIKRLCNSPKDQTRVQLGVGGGQSRSADGSRTLHRSKRMRDLSNAGSKAPHSISTKQDGNQLSTFPSNQTGSTAMMHAPSRSFSSLFFVLV